MTTSFLPPVPFYFIRHGETDLNREGKIMGSIDAPLNETGRAQAFDAGRLLLQEDFSTIISSPRIRAQETAEIIASSSPRTILLPILLNEGIVERVWGEAEGTTIDPAIAYGENTPPGAEPFDAFQQRILRHLSQILTTHKRPLIVSHGGVLKALANHLGYKDLRAQNAVPLLFLPPESSLPSWRIVSL